MAPSSSAAASASASASEAAAAAEDAYFSANPPPRHLPDHIAQAEAFIAHHAAVPGRRLVLITSGGTTVPLERQTVRFIDNFSAGTRGATSAEHFVAAGYAVIFLHREFSLQPYARHWSHAAHPLLGLLVEEDSGEGENGRGRITVRDDVEPRVRTVLREYRRAVDENMLLMLPFVTIGDYLHELRAISRLMAPLGPAGLLYLAAAVSDFFVPENRMSEHKIQSTDVARSLNPSKPPPPSEEEEEEEEAFDNFDASPRVPRSKRLIIDLDPVPKFLKNLVDGWAPQGMIVSYKLETDPSILVGKARHSLDRYQHHLVIGNLLTTRKWEVVFVAPEKADRWLRVARTGGWGEAEGRPLRADELPREEPESEIEGLIIPAVEELHGEHIQKAKR